MAGPFTHFMIVGAAMKKHKILAPDLFKLLNKHSSFLYLGSVSPDLPYLSFKTGLANWADLMHYKNTNGIVLHGYDELRKTWSAGRISNSNERILAWLFGYMSHLIVDATIHPIVEAIVGPYKENSKEHRKCEMTQDSLIFFQQRNSEIQYSEFSSTLKFCRDSKNDFDSLMDFWQKQTLKAYPDAGEKPVPTVWFNTYSAAIDAAEGGSHLVALFRHSASIESFLYQTQQEIVSDHIEDYKKYYANILLPGSGTGSFLTEGFDKSVNNVLNAWNALFTGLSSGINVEQFVRNWDLDTGIEIDSVNQIKTYWV